MIASGRAITLAALSLCVLLSQVPARAQVYAPRAAVIAQSGAKPRPRPLPPPRPIPLPYPFRPFRLSTVASSRLWAVLDLRAGDAHGPRYP